MDYTHYWNPSAMTSESYAKALPTVRKIVEDHEDILCFGDDSYKTLFTHHVSFNGNGDDGCETFWIARNSARGFEFCKTRQLPYDMPVMLCLLAFQAHCPELGVKSDGLSGYVDSAWEDALKIAQEKYNLHFKIKDGFLVPAQSTDEQDGLEADETWVKVGNDDVRHEWCCDDEDCGETAYVSPDYYQGSAGPVCPKCDDDMTYVGTEISKSLMAF
jgi:hypothetical protein